MPKSWIAVAVAVFAALVVAGVGFAAFTSSVYINGSATAGTEELEIISISHPTCSVPANGLSGTYVGNTAYFNASGLYPGGPSCTANIVVKNVGSLPAWLNSSLSYVYGTCSGGSPSPPNCYEYYDSTGISLTTTSDVTTGSAGVSNPIAPGSTYTDSVTFSIPAGATGVVPTATVDETITGSWGL